MSAPDYTVTVPASYWDNCINNKRRAENLQTNPHIYNDSTLLQLSRTSERSHGRKGFFWLTVWEDPERMVVRLGRLVTLHSSSSQAEGELGVNQARLIPKSQCWQTSSERPQFLKILQSPKTLTLVGDQTSKQMSIRRMLWIQNTDSKIIQWRKLNCSTNGWTGYS